MCEEQTENTGLSKPGGVIRTVGIILGLICFILVLLFTFAHGDTVIGIVLYWILPLFTVWFVGALLARKLFQLTIDTWLKGGIFLLVLMLCLFAITFLLSPTYPTHPFCVVMTPTKLVVSTLLSVSFIPALLISDAVNIGIFIFIANFAVYFLAGALVGLIIGKLKSKPDPDDKS